MKNFSLRKTIWIMAIALSFVPLQLKISEAADYRWTPSIRLGEGWDSNIFGTIDNVVSDFYTTATPQLILDVASPTLSMQLLGSVEGRWYYDHPDVSSSGYTKNARLTSAWKPTARFTMSPAAYYLETYDQTARAFLVPVDPTIPSPGVATYGLQKTRDYGASIGLLYLATPTLETAGTVYGAAHQFPNQPGGADSNTIGLDMSARHTFSPRSSAGVYVNGSKDDYKQTPDSRVLTAGVLGGYQFSPAFRIDGRLGMSFVRQAVSATDSSYQTTNDPSGNVNIAYLDNTFRADLYGNFGYTGLSGSGQVSRQGTVGITLADQFTQRWSWNLGGNYQITQNVFGATSNKEKSLNGTGSIRYAPWNSGSFDLTGNSSRQQWDVPNWDQTRYSVVLGFTLGKTYTAF